MLKIPCCALLFSFDLPEEYEEEREQRDRHGRPKQNFLSRNRREAVALTPEYKENHYKQKLAEWKERSARAQQKKQDLVEKRRQDVLRKHEQCVLFNLSLASFLGGDFGLHASELHSAILSPVSRLILGGWGNSQVLGASPTAGAATEGGSGAQKARGLLEPL